MRIGREVVGCKVQILGAFFFFCLLGSSRLEAIEVKELVSRMDELYRAKTSQTKMELHIVTPQWERTLTLEAFSEGMNKTLIRILGPKKDQGIATLRVEDQMWNYFPKVNKVIKVPPSMMMGSWMGSDFTNDDLVRETSLAEDYEMSLLKPDGGLYVVELKAKEDAAIVWSRLLLYIKEKELYPVRFEYFDDQNKLARKIVFKDLKSFGTKTIPSVMEVIPSDKKGHKTVIRYLKANFDEALPKDLFSLRSLRR